MTQQNSRSPENCHLLDSTIAAQTIQFIGFFCRKKKNLVNFYKEFLSEYKAYSQCFVFEV